MGWLAGQILAGHVAHLNHFGMLSLIVWVGCKAASQLIGWLLLSQILVESFTRIMSSWLTGWLAKSI